MLPFSSLVIYFYSYLPIKYIYIHTYIHTYIHIYIYIYSLNLSYFWNDKRSYQSFIFYLGNKITNRKSKLSFQANHWIFNIIREIEALRMVIELRVSMRLLFQENNAILWPSRCYHSELFESVNFWLHVWNL